MSLACGISQDYVRRVTTSITHFPAARGKGIEDVNIFGDKNKVNSPTIIVNNGTINNGPGAGSINTDNGANGCQQRKMMQVFSTMMAAMMTMVSQLFNGQNQCDFQNPLFAGQNALGFDILG